MAELLTAAVGIAMVAGIGWLAVASFVADARMQREVDEEIAAGDAQVTDIRDYLARERG